MKNFDNLFWVLFQGFVMLPTIASKENEIKANQLKDLNEDILRELCPLIGHRILIKSKLDQYFDRHTDTGTTLTTKSVKSLSTNDDDLGDLNNLEIDHLFSTVRPPFPDFDLSTLLSTSPCGNSIITYYQTHNTLTSKHRNQLVDIIVRHVFTRIVNHKITHEEYNLITGKIIVLFPKESSRTYFIPPVKKDDSFSGKSLFAKGKLVDKIRNTLHKSGEKRKSNAESKQTVQKTQKTKHVEDLKDSHVIRKMDEPQFERPIGNHTFHIGKEAVLGCSIVSLGKHKVGWLRAEDQTVLSLHERVVLGSRYSVSLDTPRTWQLRIRPLRAEDRGCYMCQINTQPTMKWQMGCIDVYVPPDIMNEETSADVSAQELDNVTLVCRASGHPPPKITWRREDHEAVLLKKHGGRDFYKVESYVGSSLPLWRVDRRQMGAFLCIASNDVPPAVSKRIILNVNYNGDYDWRYTITQIPPTVIVPNQLLGAPLGTDVVLECTIEAYPNTINYWLRNRGEMLLDGPKYTITEERSSYKVLMKLNIRNFARSDIGTYNCVSTNSLGKSEGTLRLYEIKLYPSSQSAAEVNVGGLTEGAVKQKTSESDSLKVVPRTICAIVMCILVVMFV